MFCVKKCSGLRYFNANFKKKTAAWRFEFAEMVGGKTVVFVYHLQRRTTYCRGPNAFFVLKK
jgi:hypothetical protein